VTNPFLEVPPKFPHYNSWKPQDVMRMLDQMKACLHELQERTAALEKTTSNCSGPAKKRAPKPADNDLG